MVNGDARLRELAFLAKAERDGPVSVEAAQINADEEFRSMLVHLLHEGYLNGLDTVSAQSGEGAAPHMNYGGKSMLQLKFEAQLWGQIRGVLARQGTLFRISHAGRVRRSELEQALRTGRDREPFGILWAERHRDQAVMMAVLAAHREAPVSLGYLDMNGLKAINDQHGHHAGDQAIRTYLQTIAMVAGDGAEAFRSGGADEVVVVMRATPAKEACLAMRSILRQLRKERVHADGREVAAFLTAACGVVSTSNPAEDAVAFIKRADEQQKRAKDASRTPPRDSFLAVEGGELERVSGEPAGTAD